MLLNCYVRSEIPDVTTTQDTEHRSMFLNVRVAGRDIRSGIQQK